MNSVFWLLPFSELLLFCIGLFSGSMYFIWSSLISLLVYRMLISTLEMPPSARYGLKPLNLYKTFWYFLLVVSPLMNNLWKPPVFPLPYLSSNTSNNHALLIITFSAISSSLGYRLSARRKRIVNSLTSGNVTVSKIQSRAMILIGILGICLLLGLTVLAVGIDSSFATLTPDAGSLPKFLSIVLPPFLLHGIVLRMSSIADPKRRDYLKFLILIVICLIPFSLYRLNRASLFVPILALMIPLVFFKSRLSLFIVWLLLISLGGIAVQGVGNFRAEKIVTKGGQISLEAAGYTKGPSLKTAIFNYLNAYEYVGYGLQEIDRREFSVVTPLYSIARPLPKLSRLDAENSGGTGIYNRAVYHKNVYDQICSTVLEVFLSWGFLGLGLFFFVQGRLMQAIQRKYDESVHLYPRFFLAYVGFWIAFTPSISISVLTQIFFYNIVFIAIFLKVFRYKGKAIL